MSAAQVSVRKPPSAARLRQKAWYQQPRWRRLLALLVTAVVMAQVTGVQGERGDLFYALEENFSGGALWGWLGLAAGIWLIREFAHELIGRYTSRVKEEAVRPVSQRADILPANGFTVGSTLVWLPAVLGKLVRLAAEALRLHRWLRGTSTLALLGFLIVLPLMVSTFWQQVLVDQIGMFVLVAIGLNVVVGWAGMLDLGFIAFFAIGAYSAAFWTGGLPVEPPVELNNFLVIPVAVLTCLIAGVLLGAPTLRLRGDYLAIVTLGFHEIVYLTAKNWTEFTGGPRGAQSDRFSVDLGFWSYEWGLDPQPYYWLQLGFVVVVLVLFMRLEHSRVGRAWTAIREDEVAAAATGVDTVRFKLLAFAIGASTSGIAGVIYASKLGFINSEMFVVLLSVLALSYVVFGGMGSLPGVLLGTAMLVWLPEYLRDTVDAQDRYMYLGGLLVVMMIYRPQGLLPSRRRQRELRMAEEGSGHADALGAQPGGAQG
ncbi:branched-chain amino acid ABC transporter permease [Streptomyces litchfieldiae]|uniref:Branched-chain amino acid ABC transporter permease n=1 Tax=Streptomyces litchfieldiae TaxID=3075543 RepID=A0ABU2MSU1_9ACTN|nr:branched-chain amino acid ABC transporter permease [Streptomyces sp. DSM 44938]MDT0344704.1 branched-chain amino acid ABC transporter permease [Streptomyces sp. DSM 44938]